ncbi:alpha-hydroxy acid oxidase [Microbacterium lacus]|uniref:Alpha-hydroxy acid oxidase n=1 Tax=Microbacterium lacus TaxID=415217 RepID=A0ABP4SZC6_9MICO
MSRLDRAVNIDDIRRLAKRRLPRAIFDVIEGGAGDDGTLAANRDDFSKVTLLPRSLVDVRKGIDLTTNVVGQTFNMPVMLAPASFGRMANPEAERAVAKAAAKFGTGYIMPGGASEPVEAVAKASDGGPLWYQIYLAPDESRNADLVDRVRASGFQALVVSVDTPMKPYRERDMRNGISLPLSISPRLLATGVSRPKWALDFVFGNMASGFSVNSARRAVYSFEAAMAGLRPVTLDDIAWLRERWDGPLIVKGILSDDKIIDMIALGVDGVSVSNHGGRNLDGVASAISALPRVVDAAGDDLDVLVDGGIRRGIDVVRALALGAKAALMGRPYMYGLAAGGQRGVERVIELMRNEIHIAFAFTGCLSVEEVNHEILQNGHELFDVALALASAQPEPVAAGA